MLMNYEETIEYLYNSVPMFQKVGATAYKEGLYNTLELDKHFNHPHRKFKTIHIAGTNGKGSCSHTIAAILQAEGHKVGLYTSPHLVDFRERIRVNGKCISKDYVVDFVEKEKDFFEPLHPSFFELTTALAFKYFAEEKVDYAVIEVGLGGRLDCTNIISPILSIITNIGFDHTQFLGNTLPKIATEKAGIIKKHTPVVIGEYNDETKPVFAVKAQQESAPIYYAEDEKEILSTTICPNGGIDYTTKSYGLLHGELSGIYQKKNTATVLCAATRLCELGAIKDKASVAQALANVTKATGLRGRWEAVRKNPTVVCDTGHNADGWKYLSVQIKNQPCKKLRIVFGMVDDKDIDTVCKMLPKDAAYYFTQASTHRAIPAETVKEKAEAHGLHGETYHTVSEAYSMAIKEAEADDFIFVGGSSYVVADFLTDVQSASRQDI